MRQARHMIAAMAALLLTGLSAGPSGDELIDGFVGASLVERSWELELSYLDERGWERYYPPRRHHLGNRFDGSDGEQAFRRFVGQYQSGFQTQRWETPVVIRLTNVGEYRALIVALVEQIRESTPISIVVADEDSSLAPNFEISFIAQCREIPDPKDRRFCFGSFPSLDPQDYLFRMQLYAAHNLPFSTEAGKRSFLSHATPFRPHYLGDRSDLKGGLGFFLSDDNGRIVGASCSIIWGTPDRVKSHAYSDLLARHTIPRCLLKGLGLPNFVPGEGFRTSYIGDRGALKPFDEVYFRCLDLEYLKVLYAPQLRAGLTEKPLRQLLKSEALLPKKNDKCPATGKREIKEIGG